MYSKINSLTTTVFTVVSFWEKLSLFKHVLLIYVATPILFSPSAYLKIKLCLFLLHKILSLPARVIQMDTVKLN